ncbi:MAG: N-acetyltransferase, partial [Actinomycetes bacterium]
VSPSEQHCGVGSAVVREVLVRLNKAAAAGCVVLGDPGFYGRFGFARSDGLVLPDVPPEHFMTLPFGPRVPTGTVEYSPAFTVG